MTGPQAPPPAPPWLHGWAILTLCLALPLVLLGAEVTTKDVGMVDPVGFYWFWDLIVEFFRRSGLGILIEYGHRIVAWLVGFCTIVLAVGLAFTSPKPIVRRLGWAAMLAVGAQGILGKYRVDLNAIFGRNLALFHGLFAQLVLATFVSLVLLTSRGWWEPMNSKADNPSLRCLTLSMTLLVYLQIVFGAFIRHFQDPIAQRLHVLVSFLVAALVLLVVRQINVEHKAELSLRRTSWLLLGLLVVQVSLGVEAWLRRFGSGVPIDLQTNDLGRDLARTGHFVVGAALFVTSVSMALLTCRPEIQDERMPTFGTSTMGGAA